MEMTGVRKAAILLIILGQEKASNIFKLLPESHIRQISYEIADIEYVEPEERNAVVKEFVEMAAAREYVLDGGIDYARELLNTSLGGQRAKEIIDMLSQMQQKERPFAIARKADTSQLGNMLLHEHPQTVALIMCYLQPDKAAAILSEFPLDLQTEIAERIGTISGTSPTIIKQIEKVMETKFSTIGDDDVESVGGVPSLVEILNSVDRSTEKNILGVLEDRDPDLAFEVKSSLFVFEDIIGLDNTSIQRVLRDINNDDLILALKGVSDDVKEVILGNMSTRASDLINDELEIMGPVRLVAVEEAQQKIVATIRDLEEAGEIIISRGGDQDSIIV